MSTTLVDRPDVYELRPLLYPALPDDPGVNPSSPAALGRSLRCAEPYGAHLYLGSSDGRVFCFAQPSLQDEDGISTSGHHATATQDFRHVGTRVITNNNKSVERIIVLPDVHVAAVLCESTLTFHELPSFLPIPAQVLPHTKGVAAVALDDAEQANGTDAEGLVSLCIVKRKAISLVKLSQDTWRVIKDIPLPGGATKARRFGEWLCISTTSEYKVVNLNEATLSLVGLPISQIDVDPSPSSRPSIVSVSAGNQYDQTCEFLITSHSEGVTMGVFISQNGEPTAKLIEWPSHPKALTLEYPYLHALLYNDSIEVHNVVTLEKEQTVHLPPLLEPRVLSNGTSFLAVSEAETQQGMAMVEISCKRRAAEKDRSNVLFDFGEERRKGREVEGRHTKSRVLMIGKNVVQGMCRARILDAAIKSIHRGDVGRAQRLAEQAWEQRAAFDDDMSEKLELAYLNQLLGVHCLQLLRFTDASKFLLRGALDYRLVLAMFPSMVDGLVNEEDTVEVFAGVADMLDNVGDLESFPTANLTLNYCPPLDIELDSMLLKLSAALSKRIRRLHDTLLDAYRQDPTLANDPHARRILDTIAARRMIREGDGEALSLYLEEPTACDVNLIASQLAGVGCHAALASIQRRKRHWDSALELHTKLLDGELVDATFKGTTDDVAAMLNDCPDAELVHRYALWLVQRDATAGVKILTKGRGAKGARSEKEMLQELRAIDDKAATAFLEAIALTRKQHDANTHQELALSLLGKIKNALHDDDEHRAMQAITQDFVEGSFAESFVAHLALHASTSEAVLLRLKLMSLLQASTALDQTDGAIERAIEDEPLLTYEKAILYGRRRQDAQALSLLAVTLRDTNSAETYCSQDGRPLSVIVLQSIDVPELKLYSTFVARALKRAGGGPTKPTTTRQASSDQLDLFKTLLHVYLDQRGADNEFQVAATHLLNTQAMHLSTHDILATVPAHWTVRTLDTFLSRSLRREMHRVNEGQIQRAMSLAQNLEVAETLWAERRGMGGVIEDGAEDGLGGEGEDDDGQDDLGRALVEKAEAQEKESRGSGVEKENG